MILIFLKGSFPVVSLSLRNFISTLLPKEKLMLPEVPLPGVPYSEPANLEYTTSLSPLV